MISELGHRPIQIRTTAIKYGEHHMPLPGKISIKQENDSPTCNMRLWTS